MLRKILLAALFIFMISAQLASAQEPTGFEIRSVDVMKVTQDRARDADQPSDQEISQLVGFARELHATHVAISTPYDDFPGGSSLSFTRRWETEIHSQGMCVWHRHKPSDFEGFYLPKPLDQDLFSYLLMISEYIRNNPDLFEECDIFTPIPEPQNGGIEGVTYCGEENICQFENIEEFNLFLQLATSVTQAAFAEIGMPNMKIGYWGFDGFVGWGDRNLDWGGIVDPEIVNLTGEITVDHYFDKDEVQDPGVEVANMVARLKSRYGEDVRICIGEWGATQSQSVEYVERYLQALLDNGITCINYWHLGPEGNEALVVRNSEGVFEKTQYFETIQSIFSV